MSDSHLTSTASGKRRRPWRGWLYFGVALVVAAGVAVIINLLWERVEECRRVQTDLAFLQADAYELDTLEGDVFSVEKLDQESVGHIEQIRTRVQERVSRLGLPRPSLPQLEELTKKYRAYVVLVDQVFKLIDAGKIKEARQLDAAKEDPAFDALETALEESGNAYDKTARRLVSLVRTAIFLVLFSSVGFFAVLVWQFNERRHVAEVGAAGQRALHQANDNLESRVRERTAELSALNQQMEGRIAERTSELQQSNDRLQTEVVEHKRTEGELRWKTAFLEAQVNSSLDGILVVDQEDKMLLQNERFVDLFKMPRHIAEEEADEKRVRWVADMTKNQEPFVEKILHLYAHPNEISRDEIELKNGTILDRYSSPVVGKDGEYYGRIWTFRDITERKQFEAKLFQSQKMETVGKLAGGIAHEFNSILTAILGQSELLLGDLPAGSPLANNATEINKAAGRAATLTRQLLAYGRKQILQPETLDLNRVIASMEGVFQHLLGGDVDTQIVPAPGLQAVRADAGQIEQVIMNMATNAAEAMPNGGKLTLETANVSFDQESVGRYPELRAGDYVMLAITDTGAGMSEEVKARVFEPFFSTKEVGQGTGLGLSTCYGIVKQSGGHISVYSELGRGATFKIYLPQVQPQARMPIPRLNAPELPRGTETILLVEDDPALREMAGTLLRRLGYTVWAAAHGIEALSLKQQRGIGHIDLLLTDVVMPHMSGKELADRVQVLYPHTRILFTSAYTENAIVHQGVLNKGVALLQKPFTPSALAHKLREVLDPPGAPNPDDALNTLDATKIKQELNTSQGEKGCYA